MAAATPTPSPLASAEEKKQLGNECFKKGEWKLAIKHYKAAFLASHSIRASNETSAMYGGKSSASPEVKAAEAAFSVTLFANMAAAYLQLKDAEKAIKYAKQGMDAAGDAPPAKLLLRLGKAYHLKGDLYNAESVLSAAVQAHPSGAEGKALSAALRSVQQASKQHDKKLGAKLAAAFK